MVAQSLAAFADPRAPATNALPLYARAADSRSVFSLTAAHDTNRIPFSSVKASSMSRVDSPHA